MIIPERMSVYINSLDVGNGAFLDELEQEALRDDVPIIRQDMQSFLKVLLAMHQPKQILEVGTAVGFSALLMAANTEMCHITTIEKYEKRIPVAKENFQKSGMGHRITLGGGDAVGGRRERRGTWGGVWGGAWGCGASGCGASGCGACVCGWGVCCAAAGGCGAAGAAWAAASAHRRYSDFR